MSDLQKIQQLANVVNPASILRVVFYEVLQAAGKVDTWPVVSTSGSAVCTYDTGTDTPRSYEVRYQRGNIGNLVHELIHVAVNESYRQDFVNFPASHAVLPDPIYDSHGRRINEYSRQTAYMNANLGAAAAIDVTLHSLIAQTNASTELSSQQRTDIVNKFNYGRLMPHIEYDTVITQVLVWLFEWGFPIQGQSRKKPAVNALY